MAGGASPDQSFAGRKWCDCYHGYRQQHHDILTNSASCNADVVYTVYNGGERDMTQAEIGSR